MLCLWDTPLCLCLNRNQTASTYNDHVRPRIEKAQVQGRSVHISLPHDDSLTRNPFLTDKVKKKKRSHKSIDNDDGLGDIDSGSPTGE